LPRIESLVRRAMPRAGGLRDGRAAPPRSAVRRFRG
jgi:hypothetical protein